MPDGQSHVYAPTLFVQRASTAHTRTPAHSSTSTRTQCVQDACTPLTMTRISITSIARFTHTPRIIHTLSMRMAVITIVRERVCMHELPVFIAPGYSTITHSKRVVRVIDGGVQGAIHAAVDGIHTARVTLTQCSIDDWQHMCGQDKEVRLPCMGVQFVRPSPRYPAAHQH
jgi:hypothetical protein